MRRLLRRLRSRLHRLSFLVLFRPVRGVELVRLGSAYGGWWVPARGLDQDSICYLAGVGMDISFDVELIGRFGCQVWGIDPTPASIEWLQEQVLDPRYSMVPVGVSGESAIVRFYSPQNPNHISHSIKNLQGTDTYFSAQVESVRDLMVRLGHEKIDLLKLDIEGSEHDAIRSMLQDCIYPTTLCVEFDQPEPLSWALKTVKALRSAGYDLVKTEVFNLTFVRREPC